KTIFCFQLSGAIVGLHHDSRKLIGRIDSRSICDSRSTKFRPYSNRRYGYQTITATNPAPTSAPAMREEGRCKIQATGTTMMAGAISKVTYMPTAQVRIAANKNLGLLV